MCYAWEFTKFRPSFSGIGWFVRRKASSWRAAILWGAVSRMFSKQLASSLCSSHLHFLKAHPLSPSGAGIQQFWNGYILDVWPCIGVLLIYIYCHPQTDCFVLSELFNVARQVGRSKPGSKPMGIFKVLCSNRSSSVCLFTFLYPIGYQSVQFSRRALHYTSSGRKFLRQSAQPPGGSIYIVIHG